MQHTERVTITPEDFRRRVGIGRNKVYELLRQKKIAYVKPGRRYLIPATEVDRYMARNTNLAA
jgi:excisionase family DNA binding protein